MEKSSQEFGTMDRRRPSASVPTSTIKSPPSSQAHTSTPSPSPGDYSDVPRPFPAEREVQSQTLKPFSPALDGSMMIEKPSAPDLSDNDIHQYSMIHPAIFLQDVPQDHNATTIQIMQIPPCLKVDVATHTLLSTAMVCPPVTKETLSELDLNWVIGNINLRCDVNYDHDIRFTPISGERAEEKQRSADRYWLALAAELRIYLHNVSRCVECQRNGLEHRLDFPQRLPGMFSNLRILLETLVPDRDHDQVADNLDVGFLMQQVNHGVFDAPRMSSWLAKLLKSHCAPMRDDDAEAMARTVEEGASDVSMLTLVDGLKKLFAFLETMKLDVANHQIRTLKYMLIAETVPYQTQYFKGRIESGRISIEDSRIWYDQAEYDHYQCRNNQEIELDGTGLPSLLHGLTALCKPDCPDDEIPLTLQFDRHRLHQLREEVQDLVYLRICLAVFDQRIRLLVGRPCPPSRLHLQLRDNLWAIAGGDVAKTAADAWRGQAFQLSMEITRQVWRICKSSHQHIPNEEFVNTARQLHLLFDLKHSDETVDVMLRLEQVTLQQASFFEKMSELEMSEAQRKWQQGRPCRPEIREIPQIDDMARRLAHMGVLHWRVWAELAYLPFGEEMDELAEVDDVEDGWCKPNAHGEAYDAEATYDFDDYWDSSGETCH